jgi:hypothetical protein
MIQHPYLGLAPRAAIGRAIGGVFDRVIADAGQSRRGGAA